MLGHDHINTWAEMKRVMRTCFVPSSYQRDLRNRLQTLRQGSKSIDDYFKEMELLLVRSRIMEDEESKMAKFLNGLNEEISGFVEMFPYHNLQDLLDQIYAHREENSARGTKKVLWEPINFSPMASAAARYLYWWGKITRSCY